MDDQHDEANIFGDITAIVTEDNSLETAPSQWLGEKPHFVMSGTINGLEFDIEYLDVSASEGILLFEAKREYSVEADQFRYINFEVALHTIVSGRHVYIELEFENADFSAQKLPTTFELQQDEHPVGLKSNLEIEFSWDDAGILVEGEVDNWAGTLHLHSDDGIPDSDGVLTEGMISGFVTATRGNDTMVISFTAPSTINDIDD
jgi:hypothetical protein